MLSKDMERAEKRPDWVDLVPAEPTLLERLIPRRSTLRIDRRPGNRAAPPSRSPFLIRVSGNGTLVQCTAPIYRILPGVFKNYQVRAGLVLRRNCFGVVGPTRESARNGGSLSADFIGDAEIQLRGSHRRKRTDPYRDTTFPPTIRPTTAHARSPSPEQKPSPRKSPWCSG